MQYIVGNDNGWIDIGIKTHQGLTRPQSAISFSYDGTDILSAAREIVLFIIYKYWFIF